MGIFRRNSDETQKAAKQGSPFRATSANRAGGRRASVTPATLPSGLRVGVDAFGVVYQEPTSYNDIRPITAAATQMNLNDKGEAERFKNRRQSAAFSWQQEAWEYYDAIGEIKYAFNLVASVVSRIRLYPAVVEDPSHAPAPVSRSEKLDPQISSAAERAVARLESAYGGVPGMLKDMALNLQVAGECYLVQVPERIGHGLPESWDIRSVDELQIDQRGNYVVNPLREVGGQAPGGASKSAIRLPKDAFVGRIWKTHPRYTQEADSSMRGLLDLCAELLLLNRTFRATARSRLNAGALYLPDGLSVAASPDPDYPYEDADGIYAEPTPEEAQDDFEEQLIDAMTTPIKDEDSASAVVPLIIRGPAELGDKIKQFKFERSFDSVLADRADRVLERIMQGLDVPKDIVTGLANVKYSNALQIDESLYKAHIEPLMLTIVDALTVVYLRPYLKANGFDPETVDRIVIWYDPSQVATRNDRAADADAGFDKMAVSFDTWRRAHGFSEADAPSPTELGLRIMLEKGMITPELTEALMNAVAPEIMNAAREAQQANSVAPLPPEVAQAIGTPPATEPQAEAPAEAETPTEEVPPLAEPGL